MNNNYKKIYSKKIFDNVKYEIGKNRVMLHGEKEKEVDAKLLNIINGLIDKEKITLNNDEEANKEIICSLMLYYTALYNDNVNLLNELLERNYDFNVDEPKLFVLDKRISSHFDRDLYFYFLEYQATLFKKFYYSLGDFEINVSDEESISDFCSILNKNPQVAYSEEKNYCGENIISNLLTKKTLACFDQDTILNATEKQKRNIISRVGYFEYNNDDVLKRVIKLMKYNDFFVYLTNPWSDVFEQFTDEELIKINQYDENLLIKYYDFKTRKIDFNKVRKEIDKNITKKQGKNIKSIVLKLFENK